SVRVERGFRQQFVARPEAAAADFVRIRFARDPIRQMRHAAGMLGGRSSGEARDREIETTPEKVDGAAFTAEPGAKLLEQAIGLQQCGKKPANGIRIVRAMLPGRFARNVLLQLLR